MVKTHKSLKRSKIVYILGAVIIVVVAGSIYVYHTHTKKKPIATVDQYTKGEVSQPSSQSNTTTQPSSPSNTSNQTVTSPSNSKTGGTGAALVAPTGDFVSNHYPNLSGSPAPNSMTSVCNTSPGASCQISFTNGTTTKSLPVQVADTGGATYWYWKLQDIDLTAGSWKVSATATMDGSSLSSTDPLALQVSQ